MRAWRQHRLLVREGIAVVLKLEVKENGDLELPIRPRRRLRLRPRRSLGRASKSPMVPQELGLSTLIA